MDLRKAAARAARRYGVDPDVFLAQINQESGFNPNARSPAGAQGIAQFIPSTAKAYGVNLNDGNPLDDLDGGARYMRDSLKRTGGNYREALSIYNSGRPDGYKHISETANYVKTILGAAGGVSHKSRGRGGAGPVGTSQTPAPSSAPTVPDLTAVKRQLLFSYLNDRHNPDALLSLAGGLRDLKEQEHFYGDLAQQDSAAPQRRSTGSGGLHKHQDPSKLYEMFLNLPGGINVDEGKRVGQGFVSGHTDHLHFAAPTAKVARVARMAEKMGLHVGEFEPYDKVDPVHATNSFHYKHEAADISGDPRKMVKLSRKIARRYGLL